MPRLGLTGRVELMSGYVEASEVAGLFEDAEALGLPYRSATGSQAVWTGFGFGVPVIVWSAGTLAQDICDGVDGLIAEADDPDSLARAIRRFYEPGVPDASAPTSGPSIQRRTGGSTSRLSWARRLNI